MRSTSMAMASGSIINLTNNLDLRRVVNHVARLHLFGLFGALRHQTRKPSARIYGRRTTGSVEMTDGADVPTGSRAMARTLLPYPRLLPTTLHIWNWPSALRTPPTLFFRRITPHAMLRMRPCHGTVCLEASPSYGDLRSTTAWLAAPRAQRSVPTSFAATLAFLLLHAAFKLI
jgi:hypothetical protein